ncbi:cytochrome P450 [Lophiotrema nucula]|uniref:Cytochrome P450 n=1 Tax=Lophiotrema nucula TaxID=690887 RepID=A0A6A5Z4M7_9PLEO|nr:cytochrome P450 [Lophiotrema nucula]
MDAFLSILSRPSAGLIGVFTCLYFILGAIYRLYLCPVAHVPGPRLAALSFWYELYYDVVRKGRYGFRIQELHKQYGPVIRINPYEIHCIDPEFYDEVYVGNLVAGERRRTEKWEWSARMFGTTMAAVGTTSHELHRLRRAGLNPFFSKRSIAELEPVVQNVVDKACLQLERRGREGIGRGEQAGGVNLRDFFAAFSADLIGEVAFGEGYGLVDKEDFEPGWQKLMMDLSRSTHLMKQFPWAYQILTRIPERLVALVHPLTKKLFDIRHDTRTKIDETRRATDIESQGVARSKRVDYPHPTVLQSLLTNPHLPAHELKTPRLEDEAFTLLGAGTITTAHTLTAIVCHILANPFIQHRLESSLSMLFAHESNGPIESTLAGLESLQYLNAVVQEGLRLSFGVSHRLSRVNPDAPLHYHRNYAGKDYDFAIPAGTPVSMTQMFVHLDPNIYETPHSFKPERWLSTPNDTEQRRKELRKMKHYLVPFSRGTRMCVGMHLAYAELYLMVGALFRDGGVGRRMRLWKTDESDVECVHDFFNPSPRLDSKGVRVQIIDQADS